MEFPIEEVDAVTSFCEYSFLLQGVFRISFTFSSLGLLTNLNFNIEFSFSIYIRIRIFVLIYLEDISVCEIKRLNGQIAMLA